MKIYLLQGILDELGDNFIEHGAGSLKARIGVDLDQPDVVVGVDHEVQPKYLEVVNPAIGVDVECRGMNHIGDYLFHLGVDHVEEVKLRVLLLYELVKFLIVDLVALLELPVVRQVLLHCVVGQMYAPTAYLEGVLCAGRPHISLFVPVPFHPAVATI